MVSVLKHLCTAVWLFKSQYAAKQFDFFLKHSLIFILAIFIASFSAGYLCETNILLEKFHRTTLTALLLIISSNVRFWAKSLATPRQVHVIFFFLFLAECPIHSNEEQRDVAQSCSSWHEFFMLHFLLSIVLLPPCARLIPGWLMNWSFSRVHSCFRDNKNPGVHERVCDKFYAYFFFWGVHTIKW